MPSGSLPLEISSRSCTGGPGEFLAQILELSDGHVSVEGLSASTVRRFTLLRV